MSYDVTTPVSDALAACERLAIGDDRDAGGVIDNATAIERTVAKMNRDEGTAITTGLIGFDGAYSGMRPGQLIVLAGSTGSGKSALALQVAEHVAASVPTLYASLEMAVEELTERRIKRAGSVTDEMRAVRLTTVDAANIGLSEIAREARRPARQLLRGSAA